MKKREFSIPFSGLKQGKHEFDYVLENEFFESFGYTDFNNVKIILDVLLKKMNTLIELELIVNGSVNVNCDRTNEPYDQDIFAKLELVVKFGDEYNDEDDEILIIPHRAHQINIAQYIYEMIVLAVPQKRVHPRVIDGSLESGALQKLRELQPKEKKINTEDTDPRWDVLKKLITDK
ncbi:FIG01269488: protein, clustered with ribosomal protein L32p [hydrothermal vent metagenome]|uniref:FIG01269488: protein, clustered with ribosomal protein L32p n=1 Tax=hydrothermal vent metagenome TaxID=652676 RepID=A0A3B0SYV3_9ZZZZ